MCFCLCSQPTAGHPPGHKLHCCKLPPAFVTSQPTWWCVWHKQHVQADADGWWIRSGMSKDQSMGQIQPLNFHRPAGSLKKSGICGFSKNLLWLWIWSHGPSVTVSGSFLKMSTENKKEKLTVRATTSRTSGNWHLFSVKYERTLSAQCAKRLWLLSRSSISKGWQDMLTTTS